MGRPEATLLFLRNAEASLCSVKGVEIQTIQYIFKMCIR